MQFPNEPTFADRLVLQTKSFRYRCGPMILLAVLFMARESPRLQVFGMALLGWVAFEALLKLYIGTRKT